MPTFFSVGSVGFIGTNRVLAMYCERSGAQLMRINGPYTIIGFVVMGIIPAVWY